MEKQTFQDLKIWQLAHQQTLKIYKITSKWPSSEKFGLIDQIRRSASSVPTNIVEGYGRQSNKEFRNFLYITLGSLEETKYHLLLAKDLHFLEELTFTQLYEEYEVLRRQILSFISKLKFE